MAVKERRLPDWTFRYVSRIKPKAPVIRIKKTGGQHRSNLTVWGDYRVWFGARRAKRAPRRRNANKSLEG